MRKHDTTGKLIRWELKKIGAFPAIWLLLCLLILANFLTCFFTVRPNAAIAYPYRGLQAVYRLSVESPEVFEQEHRRLADTFGDGNPDRIYSEGMVEDVTLFAQVKKAAVLPDAFRDRVEKMIAESERILAVTSAHGETDSYRVRYQRLVIEKGNRLLEISVPTEPVHGWDKLFSYSADAVFLALAAVFIAVLSATEDRSTGAEQLIRSCKKGKSVTVLAKAGAVAVSVFAVLVLAELSSFCAVWLALGGYSDPFVPIQSMSNVTEAFFPLTEYTYFGLSVCSLFCKFFGLLLLALPAAAVAALLPHPLMGYAGGVTLAAAAYGMSRLPAAQTGQWALCNIFSLSDTKTFFSRARYVSLFGRPLPLFILFGLFGIALMGLSFAAMTLSRTGAARPLRGLPKLSFSIRLPEQKPKTVFGFEIRKNRAVLLLSVLVLAAGMISSSVCYRTPNSAYERCYRGYIEKIGGEYTEEKESFLLAEKTRVSQTIARESEVRADWEAGRMTAVAYSRYLTELNTSLIEKDVLDKLLSDAAHLRRLRDDGIAGSFVYETGFLRYAERNVGFFLPLYLAFLCCAAVTREYRRSSFGGRPVELIQTTCYARRGLFSGKVILCTGFSGVCVLLWNLTDLLFARGIPDFPDRVTPLVSVPAFADAPSGMTVGSYVTFGLVTSVLGAAALAALFLSLAWLCENTIFSVTACLAVSIVPGLLSRFGFVWIGYADVSYLVRGSRLMTFSIQTSFLHSPVWLFLFLAFALGISGVVLLTLSLKKLRYQKPVFAR